MASISYDCLVVQTPCVIEGKESMPVGQVQLCKDDIGFNFKPIVATKQYIHVTSTLLIGDARSIVAMCNKRNNTHSERLVCLL